MKPHTGTDGRTGSSPPSSKRRYGDYDPTGADREEIAVRVTAADYGPAGFDGPAFSARPGWLYDAIVEGRVAAHTRGSTDYAQWDVRTADGTVLNAAPGDWIIRRENGGLSVVQEQDAFILINLRPPTDMLNAALDENRNLKEALAVPRVWSDEERDGMVLAFAKAQERHGHAETLFAVAAWLLRYRAAKA